MSFVFVPSAPSDRAQRLARQLDATIESFQRENPTTSGMDIQQALGLVKQSQAGTARILIMVGVLLAVAFGFGVFYLTMHR